MKIMVDKPLFLLYYKENVFQKTFSGSFQVVLSMVKKVGVLLGFNKGCGKGSRSSDLDSFKGVEPLPQCE